VTVAIVIPAFNEAHSIADVVTAVVAYGTPVVVDDGSEDDTGARAAAAGALVVRHDRNGGYDKALASGFAKADEIGAEFIVTTDADGQLDAGTIPAVLDRLNKVPLVIGLRENGGGRWSERLFNVYTQRRFAVADILCGMKGFRTDLFRTYRAQAALPSVFTALALAMLRAGTPFTAVPVKVRARPGRSRFGGAWRGNLKILKAFGMALRDDLLGR
jgi:glycosyltransferase involved in cell wall biosynthesis